MQKVILTLGLPASGKSTWAKKYVEDNPSYVRVNRDDLRHMRGKYWIPEQEELITDWEYQCINYALLTNFNVVIDDCNLNPKYLKKLVDFIKQIEVRDNKTIEISYQDFREIPLKTCIERDLKRPNSVGASVIRRMYFNYIQHNINYVQPENGIKCCLVDLDGTLSLFGNANPFDRDFSKDKVNLAIARVLDTYKGRIFIFSGRNDKYLSQTLEWLNYHDIRFSELYMRKNKDTRPDYEVKKEMFDNIIRDNYYVEFVFDDRPQIVELWKSLGLTVFNVGDGVEF